MRARTSPAPSPWPSDRESVSKASGVPRTMKFPDGFLWGTATAAHQVEGSNLNCDSWLLEHIKGTLYADVSGDACDQYHRYRDDMALLASLGFNSYRFSI